MRRLAAVLLLCAACGGPQARPFGYYDLSPNQAASQQDELDGVGKLCDTGRDCAGGLACTNLLSVEVTECEMPLHFDCLTPGSCPLPAAGSCPTGFTVVLAASANPGEPLHPEGYFCMRACSTGADCRNGQCCLGPFQDKQFQPWCVYDYPPRWPTTPLLCG